MGRLVLERFSVGCLISLLIGPLHAWTQPPGTTKADNAAETATLLEAEQAAFFASTASVASSVVQIETFGGLERVGAELISEGPTTGTVVGKDGWIISSLYSFRQQPASILVSLADGTRVPAKIVARDHSRELVLLKIEAKSPLTEPTLCPLDEVGIGQWAIALGRTFERDSVSQSVGIISALDRAYGKAVQTDAKVSPVNYGGPLIDLQGRVMGVLAPISPGAILEGDSSQLYDSGIGFAIPLEDILKRLPDLQAGRDIRSGKLGIVVVDQNELAGPVKLAGATPGSPAAKAGLKPGDTIIEAAGRKVQLLAHLRHALGPADAGTPFAFTVLREGKPVELKCTLVEQVPAYRMRYLGIEADNLVGGGVRITKIVPKSPAAETQLEVGTRILAWGETTIHNTTELRQQISIAEIDTPLTIKVATDDAPEAGKSIDVKVTVWPSKLESANAQGQSVEGRGQGTVAESKVEDIELVLGDFPNKAWAWCPVVEEAAEGLARPELGLLILMPEPGEVDRAKLRELWLPLIRDGWCVAMVQSENKSRWSAEELELIERVRSLVADKREIDSARTVVGGLGIGGRLALIGARSLQGKVGGVLLLATPLENVKVQRENTPSDSLHFLIAGPREGYQDFVEQLQKFGFPAIGLPAAELVASKWESIPIESITDWLLGLGRI